MKPQDSSTLCSLSPVELQAEFSRLGPWVSGFEINGAWYGGAYNPLVDPRVDIFRQHFPDATSALEIGCLEGGHTVRMRQLGLDAVIAVEGRAANIAKAQFISRCFGYNNEYDLGGNMFFQGDVDKYDFEKEITYAQAVFCCGVLYHLSNPGRFIQQMARITSQLYIWTHYHAKISTYIDDGGEENLTAGLASKALWLSQPALLQLVEKCGFKPVLVQPEPNKNGPAITLVLKK